VRIPGGDQLLDKLYYTNWDKVGDRACALLTAAWLGANGVWATLLLVPPNDETLSYLVLIDAVVLIGQTFALAVWRSRLWGITLVFIASALVWIPAALAFAFGSNQSPVTYWFLLPSTACVCWTFRRVRQM
jgi:hypothetical protein